MSNPARAFARYVIRPSVRGGCSGWSGCRNQFGYGLMRAGKRQVRAHRFAWEMVHGPIPDGLCVLHRCDNPPCTEIDHLWLGTKADNNADKQDKGRGSRGIGSNKLTEAQVMEIRALAESGRTYRAIAREFGIDRSNVGVIVRRLTWAHVP